MTLQQLEYFICVAEEGNFSRAAEKMYISRQAMSHSIHELEDSLGCRVLIAGEKQVQLTAQGSILYRKGKDLISQFKDLEQEIALVPSVLHSAKIAISDTLLPNLSPEILEYLEEYGKLHLGEIESIEEVNNDRVPDCVENDYDIGFYVGDSIKRKNLDTLSYRTYPLRYTLLKSNPLAQEDKITYEQISKNILIVPGDPNLYLKTLVKEFEHAGVPLNTRIITGTTEAGYCLEVENGYICTDIPWSSYNTKLVQKQLDGSHAALSFNIVIKKNSDLQVRLIHKYILEKLRNAK